MFIYIQIPIVFGNLNFRFLLIFSVPESIYKDQTIYILKN